MTLPPRTPSTKKASWPRPVEGLRLGSGKPDVYSADDAGAAVTMASNRATLEAALGTDAAAYVRRQRWRSIAAGVSIAILTSVIGSVGTAITGASARGVWSIVSASLLLGVGSGLAHALLMARDMTPDPRTRRMLAMSLLWRGWCGACGTPISGSADAATGLVACAQCGARWHADRWRVGEQRFNQINAAIVGVGGAPVDHATAAKLAVAIPPVDFAGVPVDGITTDARGVPLGFGAEWPPRWLIERMRRRGAKGQGGGNRMDPDLRAAMRHVQRRNVRRILVGLAIVLPLSAIPAVMVWVWVAAPMGLSWKVCAGVWAFTVLLLVMAWAGLQTARRGSASDLAPALAKQGLCLACGGQLGRASEATEVAVVDGADEPPAVRAQSEGVERVRDFDGLLSCEACGHAWHDGDDDARGMAVAQAALTQVRAGRAEPG
jgi:hypothetical protein